VLHREVKKLGEGRSAEVFLVQTRDGFIARKIFTSSTMPDLLHVALFGAPNPYRWNYQAIMAALYRRRVLHKLLKFWFPDGELTIANAVGWGYDKEREAFYLDTEYVEGRTAAVATPFDGEMPTELAELKEIMRKLDLCLTLAGFAGARWQAGFGQPCAYANFLLVEKEGKRRWAWIDCESAVPAIFATDPAAEWGYYLKEWSKRGKPLFDDVDIKRLGEYLVGAHNGLLAMFDASEVNELFDDFHRLSDHESAWREPNKLLNNLGHRLHTGEITAEQHRHYKANPTRWLPRTIGFGLKDAFSLAREKLPEMARKLGRKLNPIPYLRMMLPSHRRQVACKYLEDGVLDWQEAGRFSDDVAENTKRAGLILSKVESNPYLADFGAHLAIWPIGKILTIILTPVLFMPQVSDKEKWLVGALIIWGDSIARFIYSLTRAVADKLAGKSFMWCTPIIAPIKWFGYGTYPYAMIYSASGEHESEFLIYLLCSHLAEKIPIYGGKGTGAEYRLNRVARSLIKAPSRLILTWGYSMATVPILLLLYFTWPMPEVSLAGAILSVALGLWAWVKINSYY